MSSPSFYTGAGNFVSAIQGGVDPRTGLFNVNLPLASLRSGDLAGPAVNLGLRYSPLSDQDDGFGRGFTLNLSRYDRQKRKLYISTGESYSISNTGEALLQQRFKNFIFKKTQDAGARYQIIHKNGLVETLTMLGSMAYTTRIEDTLGRYFDLGWKQVNKIFRLSAVSEFKEGKQTPLCTISYSDTPEQAATFSVLPDDAEYGYDVVFSVSGGELRSVTSHADTPALVWSFTYSAYKPQWPRYLTGMTSPTGLKHEVLYAFAGSRSARFPDDVGLPSLPRAYGHTLSPGGGQPDILTRWEWSEENYLGRNLPGRHEEWQPGMDLALLLPLTPGYVYYSTENTLLGAGQRPVRVVKRSYNSFHLQIAERTLRDGKTHTVSTEYYAVSRVKLDEQPRQYQLPKKQTETWTAGGPSRSRVTRWQYDDDCNLIKEWSPDGTITEFAWYPARGDGDDCPPDPYGFKRWLKRKKVTPRRIYGDEVRAYTRHYWKVFKTLSLLEDGYAVLPDREVTMTVLPAGNAGGQGTKRVRTRVSHAHYGDIQDTLAYGRESLRTTTYWPDVAGSPGESYTQTQNFSYASAPNLLTQTETLTTHDSISLTRYTVRHPVLGHLLSEKDVQDVVTRYTWDKAGRMLKRTKASGTAYESTSTCEYTISKTGIETTVTDPLGNQIKVFYDGTGRGVTRSQLDTDGNKKWYDISTQAFSVSGEVLTTHDSDWLTGTETPYTMSTTFAYDGFGSPYRQVTSDGVTVTDITDPVALTRTVQSSGGGLTSATRTTELAPRLLLPQKETITGDGKDIVRKYKWDGHHRQREVTDENGGVTTYTWDDAGRLLTQTLPDGTVVTRTWARHLSEALLTGIRVTGKDEEGETTTWDLGSQEFDGLGRLKLSQSGGRHLLYSYDGTSPVPKSVMTASGHLIEYTREVPLDNALMELNASPGAGSQAASVKQTFVRNPQAGSLLKATEGSMVTENILFPSGLLKGEQFTSAAGGVRNANYARTLGGSVSQYTDPAGKKATLTRDTYGRMTTTEDSDLTASLRYDALGRVTGYTVTNPETKATLTTALAYDALRREISRTVTDGHGNTTKQTLTWSPGSQLKGRVTLSDGQTVLTEAFAYDPRNRLTEYAAAGSLLPQDGYSQEIKAQRYAFDALNNLTRVTTTLKDDSQDVATYHYDNADDPMQLTSVTHTHAKYPSAITLSYDADGRMTRDEAGRTLSYDAAGRLVSASGSPDSVYGYDALNRLVTQTLGGSDSRALYYRGGEQVCEVKTSINKITRLIKSGHTCLGMSDDDRGVTLTAGDRHDSPLLSLGHAEESGTPHVWSPYGGGEKAEGGLPGFNGERADPLNGNYHLGNGNRAWNPRLMRFTCPDSLSPFGAGGINPYAYCAGDPVNFTDPSGHLGRPDYFWGIMGAAFTVLGLAATLLTGGLAIVAAGSVAAAVAAASASSLVAGALGVASDLTALAGIALEGSYPAMASALGWTSMATGLAGLGVGIGGILTAGSVAGRQITRVREMGIESPQVLGVPNIESYNPNLNFYLRENASFSQRPSYMAIDTDSGVRRLNIVAHGLPGRVNIHSSNIIGPDALHNMLVDSGVGNLNYSTVRALICHSADAGPGGYSVAGRLSQLLGKPVEGFHGRVFIRESMMVNPGIKLNAWPLLNDEFIKGGAAAATQFMQRNSQYYSIGLSLRKPNNPEMFGL